MISTDSLMHILGFELLVIFITVRICLDNPAHKQVLGKLTAILLCLMLGHAITHVLPDKIARFVYSPHHGFSSKRTVT